VSSNWTNHFVEVVWSSLGYGEAEGGGNLYAVSFSLALKSTVRPKTFDVLSFSPTTSCTTTLVSGMTHSSNVMIHASGSTFNSAQGDFHIRNRDSESGMYNFGIVKGASLSITQ
jgi:hypothetical protein